MVDWSGVGVSMTMCRRMVSGRRCSIGVSMGSCICRGRVLMTIGTVVLDIGWEMRGCAASHQVRTVLRLGVGRSGIRGTVSILAVISLDVAAGDGVGSLEHLDGSANDLIPSREVLLPVLLGRPVLVNVSMSLLEATDFTLISTIGVVLDRFGGDTTAFLTKSEGNNVTWVGQAISDTS